jgi:ribonucrease Y
MDVANISLAVLIPAVIFLIALFFFLGWILNTKLGKKSLSASEEKAKQIISDAQKESQNLKREKLLEVKDEW